MNKASIQRKANKLYDVRVDIYKGVTISGERGWILRPFGKNEVLIGKTLHEAEEYINNMLDCRAEHENTQCYYLHAEDYRGSLRPNGTHWVDQNPIFSEPGGEFVRDYGPFETEADALSYFAVVTYVDEDGLLQWA